MVHVSPQRLPCHSAITRETIIAERDKVQAQSFSTMQPEHEKRFVHFDEQVRTGESQTFVTEQSKASI